MRRSWALLSCLFALFAGVGQAFQTPGAGSMSGRVTTGAGTDVAPVARARVILRSRQGPSQVATTDRDGRYSFTKLQPTTYTLRANKGGLVFGPADANPPNLSDDVRAIVAGGRQSVVDLQMYPGAALDGRVVFADGRGVEGVVLAAESVDGSVKSESITDDLGHFRIHTLRPGAYFLRAVKQGEIGPGDESYFPWRSGQARQQIDLSIGQELGGLDLFLPSTPVAPIQTGNDVAAPGSDAKRTILGRVIDESTRRPIADATIELRRDQSLPMRPLAKMTDTQGAFAFEDVAPGIYFVNGKADGYLTRSFGEDQAFEVPRPITIEDGSRAVSLELKLPRGSSLEGVTVDDTGRPVVGIQIQVNRVDLIGGKRRFVPVSSPRGGLSDDRGRFRLGHLPAGQYYVAALVGPFSGLNDGPAGFETTFYPQAADPAQAQPVELKSGQTAQIVIGVLPVAATRSVRGSVVDPNGAPVSTAAISLLRTHGGDVRSLLRSTTRASNGYFEFPEVPPGTYVLQAQTREAFGSVELTVGSDSDNEVTLKLSNGFHVTGRFVFPRDTLAPPIHLDFVPVRFTDSPAIGMGGPVFTALAGDRFELSELRGQGVFRVSAPMPWVATAIGLAGNDVLDLPVSIAEDLSGLEVTLEPIGASVAGTAERDGQQVSDFVAVIFAEDPLSRRSPSRFVRAIRSDQRGRFAIDKLPPGRYFAAAVGSVTAQLWQDEDFLRALEPGASRLVVAPGASSEIRLKLLRPVA